MTSEMKQRPPFDCVALLFQGGDALCAYQAGVYEAPADADIHPDWTAGITIGAINGALIAGNAPHQITKTSSPSSFSTTAANRTN
jgi:NTE family protein